MDRDEVALILGIRPDQVRIIPTACGGGFGGKLDLGVHPLLAIAAWRLGDGRAGPRRLDAPGVDGRQPEAPSGPHPRHRRRRRDRPPHRRSASTATSTPAATPRGARRSRTACRSTRWARTPGTRSSRRAGPCTRTTRPPARSAASACPRRRWPTRRSWTSWRTGSARTGSSSGSRTRSAPATRPRPARCSTASAGLAACLEALRPHWRRLREEAAAAQRRRRRTAPGRRDRGHVVRDRQHLDRQPVDDRARRHARRAAPSCSAARSTSARAPRPCSSRSRPTRSASPPADIELVSGDTDRTADAGKSSASRQTFVSGNAARLAGEDLRRQVLLPRRGRRGRAIRLEPGRIVLTRHASAATADRRRSSSPSCRSSR